MIFIFLLALILFGPKRLPEIAREVGKFVAEFKRASNDFKYQLQSEIDRAGVTPPAPQPVLPSAPASVNGLAASAGLPSGTAPGADGTSDATAWSAPAPEGVRPAPAASTVAASAADSEHERLLRTARLAFEAQNFTLRPPEPPPVAYTGQQQALPGMAENEAPVLGTGESRGSEPAGAPEASSSGPGEDSSAKTSPSLNSSASIHS